MEEAPEDPAYKKMLDEWTAKAGFDFLEIAMDYMDLLDETLEQALVRERLLDRYGMENITPNRMDVFVFAKHDEDAIAIYVRELCDEVMRLSTITPPAVAEAKDGFRPEVDERSGNGTENAPQSS